MALLLLGCSPELSAGETVTPSSIDVNGVTYGLEVQQPPDDSSVKSAVLILGGERSDPYIVDASDALSANGYATVTIDGSENMSPDEVVKVFGAVGYNDGRILPQALVAFGAAGPQAWSILETHGNDIASAFLVSAALPDGDYDFAALRQIGIRAVFAENQGVYRSSYSRAHLPMAEIPTPHDFLVYGGGVQDDFYNATTAGYNAATWEAALGTMPEWFNIWASDGGSYVYGHSHNG